MTRRVQRCERREIDFNYNPVRCRLRRPSVRPAAADRRRRVSHVVRHSNYATQLRHDARDDDDDDDDDAEMTELQLLAGTAVFSKLEDIHFSHISILSSDY